jgi:hypothetical protein
VDALLAANVQTLCDMGFPDRLKNVQALQRNGGNIELALNELTGSGGGGEGDGGEANNGINGGQHPPLHHTNQNMGNFPTPSEREGQRSGFTGRRTMHRWEVEFSGPMQSGSAEVQTNCETWAEMERNAQTKMPKDFARELGCNAAEVVVRVIRKIDDAG